MAKTTRYYITCDDDRPVVHTIPVSVRPVEAEPEPQVPAATVSPPQPARRRPTKVAKFVRSAVRRAPAVR